VPPLITELYELSDNAPLFTHLRTGGSLTARAEPPTAAPKGRKTELLVSVRAALVPALAANDRSALFELISEGDTNARVTILGELILALHALAEGGHAGEPVDELRETALQLALDVAGALEANPPQDANDAELFIHGLAVREWAHLFAGHYKALGVPEYEAELLMIRARATNTTLSSWAHLVGAAMVGIARALEPLGKVDLATRCYHGVRLDLRYLLTRHDVYPQTETAWALYWLQRACEERTRLVPDDVDARTDLQAVRKLRQEQGLPDAPDDPRFGPIARTYLDRVPYLACIVRDLKATDNRDRPDESTAAICARYGCLSTDVEFYVSAIGSYYLRRTVLAGVTAFYDEHHEEVFAAIDYLESQNEPGKKGGA
jgi:hypothetical protein